VVYSARFTGKERGPVADERPTDGPGRAALDIAGGILGLVVFLAGVGLLVWVCLQTIRVYPDIAREVRSAAGRASPSEPAHPGAKTGPPTEASPGGRPLASIAAEFGLRIVWLGAEGLLAALIAALGARLAGAHRGRRT
jgi:hypothetical protein